MNGEQQTNVRKFQPCYKVWIGIERMANRSTKQENIFPFSPFVFRFNDIITGTNFNDRLLGYRGNDSLRGRSGSDTILGGDGNEGIVGGSGNDRLTGGRGADRFVFNSRSERRDVITDFNPVVDTIVVSARGFGGGLRSGAILPSAQFHIGSRAADRSDRFIYNRASGGLFFDADGTGGAFGQIEIADLASNLAMTRNDIFVVA
jgi:serralysin